MYLACIVCFGAVKLHPMQSVYIVNADKFLVELQWIIHSQRTRVDMDTTPVTPVNPITIPRIHCKITHPETLCDFLHISTHPNRGYFVYIGTLLWLPANTDTYPGTPSDTCKVRGTSDNTDTSSANTPILYGTSYSHTVCPACLGPLCKYYRGDHLPTAEITLKWII